MHNSYIDIGELISQKLKEQNRNVLWLAKQVGCDNSNLGKMLRSERYIYPDLLFRISIVLNEDFFAYYSKKIEEVKDGQFDQYFWSN